MNAEILAVLLGKVRPFRGDDEPSAIGKLPVAHAVAVGAMGLAGDEQADRTVHGGIDKAIHHYPADHYDWWRGFLRDAPLLDAPGAFGENISTTGLDENSVFLGDRFRLGSALVEVTQARQPCWKLDHRFGAKGVMAQVVKTRRTGWYYRVLEPGLVKAGDALSLVERPYPEWPLASLFALLIGGEAKDRLADLSALRDVPILAGTWKVRRAKLAGQLGVD
ncbi:MOSC domain-containing protein [Sphingopyxis sp. RIFCSPHIGHO2_12_FULL_65_19]|uniref:MOSC domain-containing protein n=1 Tax=Sphingopyxis sp. RIFCSPHIGHO2_12_FULL_65_19 TaxID=1802172 RepID=UPI0008D52A6B|nr:MOSC domain-containing protein [Sphingopyxis sp. RIFCSPHIGHO2_12_FULL_65_19]OHD09223.1 MAG: molybdenum cofactor biosysynthesis protein [Sphingopyxis sp. RIFCSPHIGHO2_12_FULL_65_19]